MSSTVPVHLSWDWELEIQYNPAELGEPYELYFFVDCVPSSPSDWRTSPSRLFEPITSHAEDTTRQFRFLNGYLEQLTEGKLEDDNVIPYLREHLFWGIMKVKLYCMMTSRISFQFSATTRRKLKTQC